MNLTPKQPSDEFLEKIKLLRIDIDSGKVYNVKNEEIGFPLGKEHRIYINISTIANARHISRTHIIWWKATGNWPNSLIDHRDRVKQNDMFTNLRLSNTSGNAFNASDRLKKDGLPRGVYRNRGCVNTVFAKIAYKGQSIHLGNFTSIEQAALVYETKRAEMERSTHNFT